MSGHLNSHPLIYHLNKTLYHVGEMLELNRTGMRTLVMITERVLVKNMKVSCGAGSFVRDQGLPKMFCLRLDLCP